MNCLRCRTKFIRKGRQKFCSESCRYKYWCEHNRDREREIRLASKFKHRDQRLLYGRRYYELHKEEMKVKLLAWRRANKAKVVQQVLKRRYMVRGLEGSHTLEEWEALKKKYLYRCADCQEIKPLHRDHIIPVSKNGTNYISNIQPLCQSCNSRKFNHI